MGPALASLRTHWRTVAHWVVVAAAVGYLAWQTSHQAAAFAQAGSRLAHLRWDWVAFAMLCGIGAVAFYGEMHRQLLLVGGARLSVRTVQGINFAENAISNTIPVVGGAGALAYAIDQLRRRGVDAALASWSVLVAGLIDVFVLLVLGALGLGWASRIPVGLAVLLAALIVVIAAGGWMVLTHPAALRPGVHLLLVLARWVPGLCRPCRIAWAQRAERASRRLSARIAVLQPDARHWCVLIALAVVSWALDFLTLSTSVAAVGSPVPWGALMVGFLVVQGIIALQIFPGGAGLAATGLLGVLLAAGVTTAPAAAIALLYRFVSWLGLSLLGWAVYALRIHTSPTHHHRHAPECGSN